MLGARYRGAERGFTSVYSRGTVLYTMQGIVSSFLRRLVGRISQCSELLALRWGISILKRGCCLSENKIWAANIALPGVAIEALKKHQAYQEQAEKLPIYWQSWSGNMLHKDIGTIWFTDHF